MNDVPVSPFDSLIGARFETADADGVVMRLRVEERHLQPGGIVHGGVYATLVETAASVGATLAVQRAGTGLAAVGLDNHTTFLRAVGAGADLRAEARPVHCGRRTHAWRVSITDETDGREVVVASMRLFVVTAPS